MAWDFGTVTSTAPANALANKFEAMMSDAGYTNIENYTPSTGATTTKFRVWKSSKGFHVILFHATDGTGNLNLRMCEEYSASTHNGTYITHEASNAPSGYVRSDYGYTNTFGGSADFTVNSISSSPWNFRTWNTNTTGFTYAVSATLDRFIASTLVGSSIYGWHYAGKFDTFMTGASAGDNAVVDPGPYCLASPNEAYASIWCTRFIKKSAAGVNVNAWGNYIYGNYIDLQGVPGTPNLEYDGIIVSPRYIAGNSYYQDLHERAMRGKLIGIVNMYTSSSYAFGDELLIGGTPKYKVVGTSNAIEML